MPDMMLMAKLSALLVVLTAGQSVTASSGKCYEEVSGAQYAPPTVKRHLPPKAGPGRIYPSVGRHPTVLADATVVTVGSSHVNFLRPDGTEVNFNTTKNFLLHPPVPLPDGRVLVTAGDHVYFLNPNGTEDVKFVASNAGVLRSPPALMSDGTIAVHAHDRMYFLKQDGRLKEHYTLPHPASFHSSPPVALKNGTVALFSNGWLYFVNSKGAEVSKFKTGVKSVKSAPVFLNNGSIVVTDSVGDVHFLNRDGSEKARFKTGANSENATPVLLSNGNIAVTAGDVVYFLNPDNGTEIARFKTNGNAGSALPVELPDGTLVVAAHRAVHFLNPDGTEQSRFEGSYTQPDGKLVKDQLFSDLNPSPPAVLKGGHTVVVSYQGSAYFLNPPQKTGENEIRLMDNPQGASCVPARESPVQENLPQSVGH